MTTVKIEGIIDHLDDEIKQALTTTLKEYFPNQDFSKNDLFNTFKRRLRCNTWEVVPDNLVKQK
ncbi:hypothetical protein SY27_05510 [Flavobacterium sp. 316]|uniref:Uncharacterized protein n=1 Tax=Flavobacterium sediminilitoris TaxID=2024526 RepID=A0ABY4HHQ5_9FLAO|nr:MULTISPECIES: hypothetical protein [Flavobacterium]KIX22121.1 hypothetical protein SY27_05510 [Flavobacterium sp. 316]UOX32366.1 hypothetical protein LXD69_09910 [Flavobacterium sediminilitoris]